jgi:hypothetical protein
VIWDIGKKLNEIVIGIDKGLNPATMNLEADKSINGPENIVSWPRD